MTLTAESSYQPKPIEDWAKTASVKTIPELFRHALKKKGCGPKNFLGQKIDGAYQYITYSETQQRAERFAFALIELGLVIGERVAQVSQNRPEWVITDLGVMHAGCIHVPLYPTLAPQDISYILRDSKARLVVVSTSQHLKHVISVEQECTDLQFIVSLAPIEGVTSSKKLFSFQSFLELGALHEKTRKAEMEQRIAALKPTDVCSFVYTSGTTGVPKGAMLMHGNFVSNSVAIAPAVGFCTDDVELSFLPLSHVFERIAYYALTFMGATIAYAEGIDSLLANLTEVKPTVMPCVPRVFEKFHARVLDGIEKSSPVKKALAKWAIGVGHQVFEAKNNGRSVPLSLVLQHALADKLVLSKIRDRFGGRIRLFISGGAPLRADIGDFLYSVGLWVTEGYGLTETSPIITFNPLTKPRVGSVGRALAGVELKIADDGEICTRGPHVMLGYYNKPQDTKDCIDKDGWFLTGDIGSIDSEGYLKITDRKKELLVMSNGKKVPPQPIEQILKSHPLIEQAVLLGDNQKFIAALVVPAHALLADWAKTNGIPHTLEALSKCPKLHAYLSAECDKLCAEMSSHERVKRIALLPRELSQDDGDLTPKLSVKRRVVNERFKKVIEGIYSGSSAE